MVKYCQEEVESIELMYDEQVPAKVIAEQINKDFHESNSIRNERSVHYVIRQIYHSETDWFDNLPLKWRGE